MEKKGLSLNVFKLEFREIPGLEMDFHQTNETYVAKKCHVTRGERSRARLHTYQNRLTRVIYHAPQTYSE